ncbi:MAG: SDR family oxidoreductase [Proteobacteria bacterium]|nr:SDR family oxidoreductase [Pseudomonadota bacterium]
MEFIKGSLLRGKRGLIMGVANEKSLAHGIAAACAAQGAELAFSYQGEALQRRVEPLAAALGSDFLLECNVKDPQAITDAFEMIKQRWGGLDFLVHSIAFSDKNELRGRYIDTTQANFLNSMDISCYSFVAVLKEAEKLMTNGGAAITLTYYGAEKVVPNYNVMGVAKAALEASVRYLAADLGSKNIRVNALSSGPVRTLAAAAIGGFSKFLEASATLTPLGRNTTLEDVGNSAVYLLSDLSSGVTGEVLHVDSGHHIVGMQLPTEE